MKFTAEDMMASSDGARVDIRWGPLPSCRRAGGLPRHQQLHRRFDGKVLRPDHCNVPLESPTRPPLHPELQQTTPHRHFGRGHDTPALGHRDRSRVSAPQKRPSPQTAQLCTTSEHVPPALPPHLDRVTLRCTAPQDSVKTHGSASPICDALPPLRCR